MADILSQAEIDALLGYQEGEEYEDNSIKVDFGREPDPKYIPVQRTWYDWGPAENRRLDEKHPITYRGRSC